MATEMPKVDWAKAFTHLPVSDIIRNVDGQQGVYDKMIACKPEISSSNFPRFERNLNTGGDNYNESKAIAVQNTIHHSKTYPSVIKLPIAPQAK
jgi:hypothetical protein